MMNCRTVGALCFVLLAALPASAARILCPPGGNAVIQACIDQASRGDTIVFAGSYQIDPAQDFVQIVDKGDLRLIGDDENPPLFSCQIAPDGRPTVLTNFRLNAVFNVRALTAPVVARLVFDGLRFSGCFSAITLRAEGVGHYEDIAIRNREITNNIIGINIVAPVDNVDVRHSTIERSDVGVMISTPGGADHSTGISVSGNDISGLVNQIGKVPGGGILIERGHGKVHDNAVTGFDTFVLRPGLAVVIVDDTVGGASDLVVFNNRVANSTEGINLAGRATANGRVFSNLIESCVFGVNLRFGANGWRVGLNEIHDSGVADVNLVPPLPLLPPFPSLPDPFGTSDNIIYLTAEQTYSDPGGLNTIIVRD